MSIQSLMTKTVVVNYLAVVSDAHGTSTATTTTRYAAVPCRIQPLGGSLRAMYMRERVEVSHKMYCPGTFTDIAEQDLVVDGTKQYEVRFVGNPDFEDHHLELDLRELRGAA